jgi:hypothetical protein
LRCIVDEGLGSTLFRGWLFIQDWKPGGMWIARRSLLLSTQFSALAIDGTKMILLVALLFHQRSKGTRSRLRGLMRTASKLDES